jgi:hypothetical protein
MVASFGMTRFLSNASFHTLPFTRFLSTFIISLFLP